MTSVRGVLTVALIAACGCGPSPGPPAPPQPKPFGEFDGVVRAEWDDDRNMRLLEDFAYIDPDGKRWVAPAGSEINGASIPRVLWTPVGGPFTGPYRKASVVHDVGCVERTASPDEVHRMFYYACLCGGVEEAKAKYMYWAVKSFGPQWTMGQTDTRPRIAMTYRARSVDEDQARQALRYFEEQQELSLEEIDALAQERAPPRLPNGDDGR